MKRKINLQIFADEDPAVDGSDPATEEEEVEKEKEELPLTMSGLRSALKEIEEERKREKQKEKQKSDEARKLADMNDQEKAEYERDQLKKKVEEYERKEALAEMTKVARNMLSENSIAISDDLLSMFVTTDAEETKRAVDGFIKAFNKEVQNAVDARLRGEPPRRGADKNDPMSEFDKRIAKYQ